MATKGVLLCQRWEDGVIVNVTSFRFRAPLRPERPQSPPFMLIALSHGFRVAVHGFSL